MLPDGDLRCRWFAAADEHARKSDEGWAYLSDGDWFVSVTRGRGLVYGRRAACPWAYPGGYVCDAGGQPDHLCRQRPAAFWLFRFAENGGGWCRLEYRGRAFGSSGVAGVPATAPVKVKTVKGEAN